MALISILFIIAVGVLFPVLTLLTVEFYWDRFVKPAFDKNDRRRRYFI